jgi:cell division protease FtsH
VNESALLAARHDAEKVGRVDFENAKDKVLLGSERKSLIMNDEDKRATAYHEAGHALVAMLTPDSDPVHKVTIIPRGMALGVTQTLPVEDRYSLTRDQIRAQIKHAMGGRAAEELVLGYLSTGASNDLKQATELAHKMVCQYGMSDRIGPVSLGDEGHDVFIGRDFASRKDYSEAKAQEIDDEIAVILKGLYDEAKQILVENRDLLDRISLSLLERETLEGSELELLRVGETLPPLPPLVTAVKPDPPSETPETETEKSFPGDKLPDPEPVPG